MNSNRYEKAFEIISSKRFSAIAENERRIDEINKKIPEIAELNYMLAQTNINILKAIDGKSNVTEKIKKIEAQNLQVQKMIQDHLVKNGYPGDYLDIKYSCPLCSDTGLYEGKRCSCAEEIAGKLAVEEMNSKSRINLCSFDTFDLSYYKNIITSDGIDCFASMTRNFNYCKNYANNFSVSSNNIMMIGNTGLGKTHLSLSIAERVICKGFNVLYNSIINYLSDLEDEQFGRSDENSFQIISDADLLILDDLGSEYDKPIYKSMLYNIINTRMNKGLPTIISTNLGLDEIQNRYEPRLVSRLLTAYEIRKFTGNDIRFIKAGSVTR